MTRYRRSAISEESFGFSSAPAPHRGPAGHCRGRRPRWRAGALTAIRDRLRLARFAGCRPCCSSASGSSPSSSRKSFTNIGCMLSCHLLSTVPPFLPSASACRAACRGAACAAGGLRWPEPATGPAWLTSPADAWVRGGSSAADDLPDGTRAARLSRRHAAAHGRAIGLNARRWPRPGCTCFRPGSMTVTCPGCCPMWAPSTRCRSCRRTCRAGPPGSARPRCPWAPVS